MSAGGQLSQSWRLAQARTAAIMAIFTAEPEAILTIEDVWMKLRTKGHCKEEIKKTIGTIKASGRIESVQRGYGGIPATYRLAREVRSA